MVRDPDEMGVKREEKKRGENRKGSWRRGGGSGGGEVAAAPEEEKMKLQIGNEVRARESICCGWTGGQGGPPKLS